MTLSGRAFVVLLATLCAGCATIPVPNEADPAAVAPLSSTPIRWHVKPGCLNGQDQAEGTTREMLATGACQDPLARDLVTVALSGGGTKAAVFAGEALFYLDFLGLLERTSVISAVSGGSFAGSLYALSCDPKSPCEAVKPQGRTRPFWEHDAILHTLGQGYAGLIREQAIRAFTPFARSTLSADRFAQIIDTDFLGEGASGPYWRFADLNPARPHLLLNATITSENRLGLDDEVDGPGCRPLRGRGYLRRRTPDEYFHFAFSEFYFAMLKSQLARYPLAAGVAASSAFPALIDFARLTDYCAKPPASRILQLMDGGANDNQALIELYMLLSELVYGQHRSDLWTTRPAALETLRPTDRAFLMVINSSVTEATGTDGTLQRPFGIVGLLDAVITKSLAAVDVYSAEGYALRKQAYLTQGDLLRLTQPQAAPIYPSEISLTELDQYALGGTEAALRTKAAPADTPNSDVAAAWSLRRTVRQSLAYDAIVDHADIRRQLRLPDYHPQCYYAMRKQLDASLISVGEADQACLREGARWAVALRAEEMCEQADPFVARPDGLVCENGHVRPDPRRVDRLPPLPATSACAARITPFLDPQAVDARVQCRKLSP